MSHIRHGRTISYTFIELPPFDQLRDELFDDDEYLALQLFLCENPEAGTVIPGSGGCRKLRWASKGKVKGKRGGNRVIYFLRPKRGQVVLVAAYAKNERDDIPREWLRRIRENFDGQSS